MAVSRLISLVRKIREKKLDPRPLRTQSTNYGKALLLPGHPAGRPGNQASRHPGTQAANQPASQPATQPQPLGHPAKPAANQPAKPIASKTANLPTFFPSVILLRNLTFFPSVIYVDFADSYTKNIVFRSPVRHTVSLKSDQYWELILGVFFHPGYLPGCWLGRLAGC